MVSETGHSGTGRLLMLGRCFGSNCSRNGSAKLASKMTSRACCVPSQTSKLSSLPFEVVDRFQVARSNMRVVKHACIPS